MDKKMKTYIETIEFLSKLSIKYVSHNFSSGAIMLDVWYNDSFYVVQFEADFIGFSEVTDNIGFDANPDEKFYDHRLFKERLEKLF